MKVRNQKGTYAKFVVTSLHNSDKEDINEKELENSQKNAIVNENKIPTYMWTGRILFKQNFWLFEDLYLLQMTL